MWSRYLFREMVWREGWDPEAKGVGMLESVADEDSNIRERWPVKWGRLIPYQELARCPWKDSHGFWSVLNEIWGMMCISG